jgi:hypothetical protein
MTRTDVPPQGFMVHWRKKGTTVFHFGYVTHLANGLVRMGFWNGNTSTGNVVDPSEIEWRPYA